MFFQARFESNTFDLVWGCESGEHMPDKKRRQSLETAPEAEVIHSLIMLSPLGNTWCRYVEEMSRVLKHKGGSTVLLCALSVRRTIYEQSIYHEQSVCMYYYTMNNL